MATLPANDTSAPPAPTTTINEQTYSTRHMDPLLVLRHAGKVFDLMGGQLGGMNLARGAQALAANLDKLGAIAVLEECFDLASVDGRELGKKGDAKMGYWRIHFRGKQKEMVQAIAWMLEVHFADFFAEIGSAAIALFERIKGSLDSQEEAEASTSPST